MKKLVLGLVVAAGAALSAPAVAAPGMGQAGLAIAIEESSVLQQVLHGCGAGWWRGPDGIGRCRPMRRGVVVGPPVYVAPPVVVVPRRVWCHGPYSSRQFRC